MEKLRTGFEYIDLNSSSITQGYRPYPASKPMEVYVARLHEEDMGIVTIVTVSAVYKLITNSNQKFAKRKSDGKNLVVRVTRKDLVDLLRVHYDETFDDLAEYNGEN